MKMPNGYRLLFLMLGVLAVVTPSDLLAGKPKPKRWQSAVQGTVVKKSSHAFIPKTEEQTLAKAHQMELNPAEMAEGDSEQRRYDQAKKRAKEDPEVKKLKAKADQAATGDEARRTSIAYNQTLFEKMRKIDHSVTERVDLVEVAMLKRISQ